MPRCRENRKRRMRRAKRDFERITSRWAFRWNRRREAIRGAMLGDATKLVETIIAEQCEKLGISAHLFPTVTLG
jgi:hypothetical protein